MAAKLLAVLAGIARVDGIARFEAEVLGRNASMLQVFAHSGLAHGAWARARRRRQPDVVVVATAAAQPGGRFSMKACTPSSALPSIMLQAIVCVASM